MSENHVCRVCGTTYPPSQASCPRCGALPGTARPAYLRCRQCGAVFPSSCTLCTACRQVVSPRTASVVLLSDVPQTLRPQHPVQPVVQPAVQPVVQPAPRPVQQRPAAARPAARHFFPAYTLPSAPSASSESTGTKANHARDRPFSRSRP